MQPKSETGLNGDLHNLSDRGKSDVSHLNDADKADKANTVINQTQSLQMARISQHNEIVNLWLILSLM